jgi:DNA transformation protein
LPSVLSHFPAPTTSLNAAVLAGPVSFIRQAKETFVGTSSKKFIEFVLEQLDSLPRLSTNRFFGGVAVKSESIQFAMIMDGVLYFTVDDNSRPGYEQMGSRCFSYHTKNGRVSVRKYFEVPTELLEDEEQLVILARTALEVARKSKTSKKSRG